MQDNVTATECRGPWATLANPHLC